jgi:acyl-CoA oxidase
MILVENFSRALESSTLSPELIKTLNLCFQLYSLNAMDSSARSFASTGATDEGSLDALPDRILDVMSQLRPHAVRLVDSWMMPDYLLNSALGRFDGKVYETIYDMAHRQNPLNRITFNPRWQDDEIVMGSGDGGQILTKL